jgi:type I restriction enzyme R subunit
MAMSHQSEAVLENNLIKQLRDLSYASVKIQDGEALVANLQSQLALFTKLPLPKSLMRYSII